MNSNSPVYSQLTPEESILIRASCVILTEDSEHLHKYQFWGKIFGVQNDYFVVQSTTLNPYELAVTQYSRDGRSWAVLSSPTDNVKSDAFMSGLLTGDPSLPYTYTDFESVSKITAEPVEVQMKEEDRLACLVRAIDAEGTLIPKLAYYTDQTGHIVPSPTYKGMDYENCCNFGNYYSFVALDKLKNQKDPAGRRLNALQPLLKAIPELLTERAAWRFHDKIYENYVMIHNTRWPGLCFFHAIDGNTFGRCYFGWGSKEINVPFLLGFPGDGTVTVDITFLPDYDFKRTPEEAERAAAAVAAAAKAKQDDIDAIEAFLVSEGVQIESATVSSGEEDFSQPLAPAPPSDAENSVSQDAASVDPDRTDNSSGDVSATEPDTSDIESIG